MADNYLDLDKHINANVRALQTGEASFTDRITVSTSGWKRMKRTRADGAPIWDDVSGDAVDITDEVYAEYQRQQAKQ